MTAENVEFLDLDDVLQIAQKLLGDNPPIRDIGLLAAAIARPQTSLGGQDAYPTIVEKASALLQSIVVNHALVDGNKRLGWSAASVFLLINGTDVTHISNDSVYQFVMHIATENPPLSEITSSLRFMIGKS